MNCTAWKRITGAAGWILPSWILMVSQCAWAQDAGAAHQKTASPPATAATATPNAHSDGEAEESAPQRASSETSPNGGPHDGIKVHGHWIIDIKNPDGSLVTHREFENSLVAGSTVIAGILGCFTGGNCPNPAGIALWQVQINGNPQPCNTGAFLGNPNAPTPCTLTGPQGGGGLSASVQGSTFVLSGSVAAGEDGSITSVSTQLLFPFSFSGLFTFRALPTPISVLSGQVIQVSVSYSFS